MAFGLRSCFSPCDKWGRIIERRQEVLYLHDLDSAISAAGKHDHRRLPDMAMTWTSQPNLTRRPSHYPAHGGAERSGRGSGRGPGTGGVL